MIASLYQRVSVREGERARVVSDISGALDDKDVSDWAVDWIESHIVARSAPGVLLAIQEVANDILIVFAEAERCERHVNHGLLRLFVVSGDGDQQCLPDCRTARLPLHIEEDDRVLAL